MTWLVLNSGNGAPAENMAVDEGLLSIAKDLDQPILRFYGWRRPAATFGYFQRYSDIAELTPLRPLVRRPTGGGLVSHENDWTYSLVFPPDSDWYRYRASESYQQLHQWLSVAFERLSLRTALSPNRLEMGPGQCFVGAEQNDLVFGGRKIAGAAQRRTKLGLLIQGSIQPSPPGLLRSDWEAAMLEVAADQWDVDWAQLQINEGASRSMQTLAQEKYSQASYNKRR